MKRRRCDDDRVADVPRASNPRRTKHKMARTGGSDASEPCTCCPARISVQTKRAACVNTDARRASGYLWLEKLNIYEIGRRRRDGTALKDTSRFDDELARTKSGGGSRGAAHMTTKRPADCDDLSRGDVLWSEQSDFAGGDQERRSDGGCRAGQAQEHRSALVCVVYQVNSSLPQDFR
eukprot:3170371-Prymnesium_polylepis.4